MVRRVAALTEPTRVKTVNRVPSINAGAQEQRTFLFVTTPAGPLDEKKK